MRLKLIYEKLFMIFSLFIFSCGDPPETEPDPAPDSPDPTINNSIYDIGNSNINGLFFEYSKYYFLEDEKRPIYIWGNDNGTKIEYVWFDNNNTTTSLEVTGKGPSRYWDRERFVMPLVIRTSDNLTTNDLNSTIFNCGRYPNVLHNTFTTFEQIEMRYFKVHYSYMLG